jgi:hypothetical protein
VDGEGPLLEQLTRRLAECPAEFLAEAAIAGRGTVEVAAVVADLLCDLGGPRLSEAEPLRASGERQRNRLQTILVACWLLADGWFRTPPRYANAARAWLAEGLDELARLMAAERLVADANRREELARLCLRALGLRPAGETAAQAEDRLATLNSVERRRVRNEVKDGAAPLAPAEVPTSPRASETAAASPPTTSGTSGENGKSSP